MEFQIAHKTQRRVVLRPGNVVVCVIDCAVGTTGFKSCTVAKSAFKTTVRWTGEEPVDVGLVVKSSARDGYRLVVNDDKSVVMAFGDRQLLNCRQEKKGTRSLMLRLVLK